MRNPRLLLTASLAVAAFAGACSEQKPPTPQDPGQAGPVAAPTVAGKPQDPRATPSGTSAAAAPVTDAGAPAYDGPYIAATVMQAIVLSDMEWPPSDPKKQNDSKVVRLGYLRHGAKAPVIATPHKKSNCNEGWYELVAGGFVCGKYATTDLNHPKVKGSRPPDLGAITPYTYGANTTNGTPIYRQVPSREERLKTEPWLAKPKVKKTSPDDNPYASDDGGASEVGDAGAPVAHDDNKPWYMRETDASAPVQITLDELREADGPVARRMVKGFYLSLDRMFKSDNGNWWRLNDGLIAPADRVYVAKPRSEFRGLWLDVASPRMDAAGDGGDGAKKWHLPIGFITSQYAHKFSMAQNKKKVARGGALHRQTILQLTGETVTIDGTEYFETDEGWWMRGTDGAITEPAAAPEKLAPGEKWIDVNLKRQTLVAFEGDHAVFATIVSSGRQGHETPPGSFRIRDKHVAATMDGDADTVSDGPYSIQDVPYIQYFSGSYALHGAFWHDEFGHTKSHGCVNLSPWDARAVFNWTEPQLPEGWHGVSSTHSKPGTRVVLHY